MSQTLATREPPRATFTYSETTATWTQILLPDWARRLSISPQALAIKVVASADTAITDGDAYVSDISDDAETIAADAKYSISVTSGRNNKDQVSVFVYASATTTIELAAEEKEGI